MPASQPQAITEVAKPVIAVAAACWPSSAVMMTRVARIEASAKVSSIRTPFSSKTAPSASDGQERSPIEPNGGRGHPLRAR